MATKKKTGTREWSEHSRNCVTGCEHNCRYCYARARALRFHQIENPAQWATPKVRPHDAVKKQKKVDGVIMFPTTHDITPTTLEPCMDMLERILRAGNQVLLVSKPHLDCIKEICREFSWARDQMMFRFSIGARNNEILEYWEPGAPSYQERYRSLGQAKLEGFQTSVSCEPLLDYADVWYLLNDLRSFITDSFWVGKMNQIALRCKGCDPQAVARIEEGQTDEAVTRVYQSLKDEPLVRWKDSYREVIFKQLQGM